MVSRAPAEGVPLHKFEAQALGLAHGQGPHIGHVLPAGLPPPGRAEEAPEKWYAEDRAVKGCQKGDGEFEETPPVLSASSLYVHPLRYLPSGMSE
ncbi:MAG: hypothetical protein Kow0025_13620 [Thermodesulfovibrionales bacterium]